MKNRILVVAFACVSTFAAGQSDASKGQNNNPPASAAKGVPHRDLATRSDKIVSQPAGSNATLNSSSDVTAPRDLATGQASGKRQHEPVTINKANDNSSQSSRESSAPSVSEVVVTKPGDRKTTAQDDWQTPAKTQAPQTSDGSTNQWPSKVATGDVNGDGKADVTLSNGSNVTKSRDLATGQASGKRQHEPVTVQKEVGTTPAK
jgi:FG-GAP repeat protein